ncbi:DUF378 domain-containing protein [Timonella senegalensis]|jgi:uncharacterized membrane protein YuzA (DUF378 family)|uniref:DUF378 domain-containing protein n=1 Tax=Timonella senegalensis TaxID=1465825 RepID=UPI000313648F|nr:DUF378 domain-containing protein [Timonella senegalensis]
MRGLVGVATALTIVGGINWGLVGAFDYNLVDAIFGEGSTGSKVVYIAVGVSALIALANFSYLRRNRVD